MRGLLTARRHSVSVSISETRLYAILPAAVRAWLDPAGRDGYGSITPSQPVMSSSPAPREWPLTPLSRTDAEWPALVAALTELRKALPERYSRLEVALLPPLARVRRVELPKLRAAELRLVLSRNAARYFPSVREPHTAAGIALTRSSPTPYLMAAATTRLVEAIARAAQQSGWELATIVPAPAVFAAAAPETSPPELLPERMYLHRAAVHRRNITRLAAVLTAAVVLAAAGVLARARYVLHQVVIQRTALAGRANLAAKAHGDIAAIDAPMGALGRIETSAVVWSQVVADLADVLPPDAYLSALHARGDSLSVAGTAAHGGDVFARMDGAKLIGNVRSAGPIRQEARPNMPPADQFDLTARIPGAAPLYAVKKPRGRRP